MFAKLKSAIFPIERSEFKLFFPMAGIIFGVLYNYTILRNMKDTLVINATGSAGILTFLKLYIVTPAALFTVMIYSKMLNSLGREKTFYAIVSFFVLFFLSFAFILYPNVELIHPSVQSISILKLNYPRLSNIIDIYAYWSFSLFYVLSEIWGSLALSTLFWQFANQIIKMELSKRFYPLFIILGNFSLVLCGKWSSFLTERGYELFETTADRWYYSLKGQLISVAFYGIVCMLLYRYVNVTHSEEKIESTEKKEKKAKPGIMDSFKILANSKHLQLIAMLVIAYGVTVNLVEVQWKEQVKLYFAKDTAALNAFMNRYSQWTGISSVVFGLVAGTGILRKLSWKAAAVITPAIMLIGGVIFYVCILSRGLVGTLISNPVYVAVMTGFFIVIATKVVKYSLFDSTKEMAYIPLDSEIKGKGKPAVEVLGGRLGKSGGAFIQSTLIIITGATSASTIAPYTFGFFILVACLWIFAVSVLGKRMKELQK